MWGGGVENSEGAHYCGTDDLPDSTLAEDD